MRQLQRGGTKAEVNQQALLHTIIREYVEALKETLGVDGRAVMEAVRGSSSHRVFPQAADVSNSMTRRMVQDLINRPVQSSSGDGIMILVRQPEKTGRSRASVFS